MSGKNVKLQMQATPDEVKRIKAQAAGVSVSEYLRRAMGLAPLRTRGGARDGAGRRKGAGDENQAAAQ